MQGKVKAKNSSLRVAVVTLVAIGSLAGLAACGADEEPTIETVAPELPTTQTATTEQSE